ncbi:hypothetical protein BU16DRAFT_560977 [Lophium mytilinum]|uniref:Zn(2)-C6 fungal-type domain-containing protein n=1 Tax=Lophium mytilinum TaxID=390894 RepID=A0A6A6QW89_9PEZI|nr:hypothetical protein BU16DRAFT_560977 [Lophium mytilinum]
MLPEETALLHVDRPHSLEREPSEQRETPIQSLAACRSLTSTSAAPLPVQTPAEPPQSAVCCLSRPSSPYSCRLPSPTALLPFRSPDPVVVSPAEHAEQVAAHSAVTLVPASNWLQPLVDSFTSTTVAPVAASQHHDLLLADLEAPSRHARCPASPPSSRTTVKINSSTLAPPPAEPTPSTSSAASASSTSYPTLHPQSFALPTDHAAHLSGPRPLPATHVEGTQAEGGARRQEQPRMRSSIACARCRRSKVKCVNNGVNTTCRACETSGRECTYPPPATAGAGAARRESMLSSHPGGGSDVSPQGETPRRPRTKKTAAPTSTHSIPTKESARPMLDALDNSLLTPQIWTELFEIFQQHFSTDLPFLHPPTFLRPLRQSALQSPPTDAPATPPASPLLLLAFLALTSRFHPTLVAHHSPATSSRPSNPMVAAEYYSVAAKSRLAGHYGDALGVPTLERTQALLMLGLHDWGMCQGVKAWISVGVAVRSAQALGFQFEQDLDDMPLARSLALTTEAQHLGLSTDRDRSRSGLNKGEAFIEQEIRRRTFWSCFIMDRYLASGKYRPSMLNVQELRIQLPSSERAFLFGEKVRTLMLGEEVNGNAGRAEVQNERQASVMLGTWSGDRERSHENGDHSRRAHGNHTVDRSREVEDDSRWEVGLNEGVLSRFIKALDVYSTIVKWSCSGGRRREKYPPWDQRSTFYSLRRQLAEFKETLPRDLTLTPANISAHITSRTSTPYTLMHTVQLLCSIMLHREYVPFIPIRCSKPQGPLDPPIFSPEEYQIPPGFWDDGARECFKSARDLIDLLRVYCINFPWMDPNGFMCKARNQSNGSYSSSDRRGAEAARKALEIVGHMRKRLQMADGWFKTIRRVHLYFSRMKKDFERNTRALEASSESGNSPESYRHLSLREGGSGGGLEEYKLLEKILKEFGSLEDEDLDMPDADTDTSLRLGQGLDDASDAGSSAIKSEVAMEMTDGTPDSASVRGVWNPVNTVGHQRSESGNGTPANLNTAMPGHHYNQFQPGVLSPHNQHFPPSRPSAMTQLEQAGYSTAPPYGSNAHNPTQNHLGHPGEQARQASLSLQQQLQPQQQQPALWSPATKELWLNNLETRFGGDDVAAFVAGNNWEDWAGMAAKEQGGWLSTVWGGAAH